MRVGIVNDLSIAVEVIRRVIVGSGRYEVAWIAKNGHEAVEMCARDTPDMVLMDLLMPVMNGVEATRRIMAESPCAILVVTASAESNCAEVFDAMAAGALDVVNTPIADASDATGGAAALLAKLKTIGSLVDASRLPRAGRGGKGDTAVRGRSPLVVMGASAGGPTALASVLSRLSADFPAGIVIVQHLDVQFVPGMANWLNDYSAIPVRLARKGDVPQPGTVLLAAGEDHLVFSNGKELDYSPHPRGTPYRPSVDVFFESVVQHRAGPVAGVLLSGMGRDGAAGLKALRNAGFRTFAQDRSSCVVYGMPKAAAELDAADEILPADQIGPALMRLFISSTSVTK